MDTVTMKCPYCGREMEKGLIESRHEINWKKRERRSFFGNADFYKGSVVLSELSFIKGSAVVAWLCRECKKVVIDYADERSDLNYRAE